MKDEEKVIMYDAPEAARKVEMVLDGKVVSHGYLSIDNFYYKDEDLARYQSCTHKICDCGKLMSKSYTKCEDCRYVLNQERYKSLKFIEWDETTPVVIYNDDQYFFSKEDIDLYLEEQELKASDLMLVICEPNYFSHVEFDIWSDIIPEDCDDFPDALEKGVKALNDIISTLPPASWEQGKNRTEYIPEK